LSSEELRISVVIATRDRPELLRRVGEQVVSQLGAGDELVIVDDTTGKPVDYGWLGPRGRMLRSYGGGPAVARNLGWRATTGEVVAFTDDDVRIDGGWLSAVRGEFRADPDLVAAEGQTSTRDFDRLFEYSVCSHSARNGLTCNVGYRRSSLEQLGGFDEGFPFAHCEDLDLFTRAGRLGTVKFATSMRVDHEPRAVSPAGLARRGGWVGSERRLFAKHPDLKPYPLTPLACAVISYVRWPLSALYRAPDGQITRSPARLLRAVGTTLMFWSHAARATGSLMLTAGGD
jgi:hypothetical protein